MKEFNVTWTKSITTKDIADLMSTAFDGGVAYWCSSLDYKKIPAEVVPNGVVTYSHPEFWAGDFELEISQHEDDEKILITPATLQRGLQQFAEQRPKDFWDWQEENYDADTADNFLQIVCFEDVIYG